MGGKQLGFSDYALTTGQEADQTGLQEK